MSSLTDLLVPSARWIWAGFPSFDIHNAYALFRTSVHLDAVPKSAPTLVTADQSYRLYINGRYVCRGPARGYQRTWPYDEIDLAPWLKAGLNIIAVRAHNPGFSNYQYCFEGAAGFLFMGRWGQVAIGSDRTWKCRKQVGITRDTRPSSLQLFCQEHVDARLEPDDWMMPEFDDSAWAAPDASAAWNCEPWHSLEARDIPLLAENIMVPSRLLGTETGRSAEGWQATRDVVEIARHESLWHRPGDCADFPVLTIAATGRDGFHSCLVDFGHTVVGTLRLRVSGGRGGEVVDALFAETLHWEGSRVAPRLDQPQISLGSRLTCRPGVTDHLFYHPYGFRYLVIRVRHATEPLTISPSLVHVGYPLKSEGSFDSSDSELNRIWKTCVRTQRVCMLDAYVDTPWREQAQWWGDARVQAWNTFHLANDVRLFRRGIRCIARQTTPDGLTYGHAPTMAHHCVLPDFTLIWMLTLWDDYWQTGSTETFLEHQDVLRKALDYFRQHTDAQTGLIRYDPRHWLFLDWADLEKDGQPALLSLWLLLTLDKMADLHRLTGHPDETKELTQWATRLRASLLRLSTPGGLIRDGYSATGRMLEQTSIHTQTLALMTKLTSREDVLINQSLLPFIREEITPVIRPSVYWLTYVFTVLDDKGFGLEVVRYLRKYWAQMADHGTTWSQLRKYGSEQSHSHAWSAHPLYHLMQIIGGIRQTAPGWRKIEFRPLFWETQARVSLPSAQGTLCSTWLKTRIHTEVRLEVPQNVEVTVILPGLTEIKTAGSHHWKIPNERTAGTEARQPSGRDEIIPLPAKLHLKSQLTSR